MLYTHRLLRYSIPGYRETHPEDISSKTGISVISSPDKFQPDFQVQETKNPVKPTTTKSLSQQNPNFIGNGK